jgi:hypothetical protein
MAGKRISWVRDLIINVARNYYTRQEFKESEPAAYSAARRYGVLEEACEHMYPSRIKGVEYSDLDLELIARRYQNRTEFRKFSRAAYNAALKYGIMDKICTHMTKTRPPAQKQIKWDEPKIQSFANRYSNRTSFKKGSPKAYEAAKRRKILDIVCSHMDVLNKDWDFKSVHSEALLVLSHALTRTLLLVTILSLRHLKRLKIILENPSTTIHDQTRIH